MNDPVASMIMWVKNIADRYRYYTARIWTLYGYSEIADYTSSGCSIPTKRRFLWAILTEVWHIF